VVALSRKADVVQREVAGEVFLVPIRGHLADLQELFVLNETGSWIWDRLDASGCAFDDLVQGLVSEFEVDEDTARRDVDIFARQLVESGLGETTPPNEP
jgi:hypothetical protein